MNKNTQGSLFDKEDLEASNEEYFCPVCEEELNTKNTTVCCSCKADISDMKPLRDISLDKLFGTGKFENNNTLK